MEKSLSIVIPVYNVENYLDRCLSSILKNNLDNCEILLIDDGSTDKSAEICDMYSSKYAFVRSFHKENGGASDARNFGISKAVGKYIWFVDSDDKITENSIIKFIEIINSNMPDVIICQSKVIDQKSEIYDECKYSIKTGCYSSEEFMVELKNNPKSVIFCPQYYIVKRSFLLNNELYFYKGIIYEDELWIPQLLINAKNIYYSNLNVYFHYMIETSVMHSTKLEKCGKSDFIVATELIKIFDKSNRGDLDFLRDRAANIFLQAVWKIPYFFKKRSNKKRSLPIKNALYIKTKLKGLLYFISPSIYIFVHNRFTKKI